MPRIFHRRYAEIVDGPESIARDVKSPGNLKFASTLSKIMKKMINLEIYDSPHLATALFGVPVNHTPELLEKAKSREGVMTAMTVSTEQVGSTPSSVPISLVHTTADMSWITFEEGTASSRQPRNQELSDDRTTEATSVFHFIPSFETIQSNRVASQIVGVLKHI